MSTTHCGLEEKNSNLNCNWKNRENGVFGINNEEVTTKQIGRASFGRSTE